MLYSLYELNHLALAPMRAAAMAQSAILRSPLNPLSESEVSKHAAAAVDVFETLTRRYRKPEWGVMSTRRNGKEIDVRAAAVWGDVWCNLLHFKRDREQLREAAGDVQDPRVLIVAPMSGHYATLLRGTVEAFLPEHDVFISDWGDARLAPVLAGRFDMNSYIDHVVHMLRIVGGGAHVVAVCQPGPAVLSAVALMSEANDPALPATMTFMGSPIDARRSPTVTNQLAMERPLNWFQQNLIHTVPPFYPGAFRRVYPGFLQLASFMGMNWSRHVDAHRSYFDNLVKGDGENADKHREFYDEYLSVQDLTEEFYIQSIRDVFQEFKLPLGTFEHRGHRVDLSAISEVALMTVEGEKDDISGIGQTQAAHDLCVNIPESMRIDHVQQGVGHYGVFNGRRFSEEIQPRMRDFMRAHGEEFAAPVVAAKRLRTRRAEA